MTHWTGGAAAALPHDAAAATLVGRVWDPVAGGPSVVTVRGDELIGLSGRFATMSELTETPDPPAAVRPWLLSPLDLHVVKAAGVTFPVSMLERVIEERAHGDAEVAATMRQGILDLLGTELRELRPGSPEAARLKQHLVAEGMWSQYLEVGIGPDAELFTKAPVLATVGSATEVGIRSDSEWNNPEPEVVILVSSTGAIVGATLGNDVNLRDIEGRSALLLGEAKDNNASAAVGPFIRLFDDGFDLDRLRREDVSLRVTGDDGFVLEATSHMSEISRDPTELAAQALSARHQYPDGFALYLGTMFAPVQDRDAPGRGFTHHLGDVVTISSPLLGALVNRVRHSEQLPPWEFGISALMGNLARRGLLEARMES
jgi:fumarylacetoacetate (FAA) hydrolase family protein